MNRKELINYLLEQYDIHKPEDYKHVNVQSKMTRKEFEISLNEMSRKKIETIKYIFDMNFNDAKISNSMDLVNHLSNSSLLDNSPKIISIENYVHPVLKMGYAKYLINYPQYFRLQATLGFDYTICDTYETLQLSVGYSSMCEDIVQPIVLLSYIIQACHNHLDDLKGFVKNNGKLLTEYFTQCGYYIPFDDIISEIDKEIYETELAPYDRQIMSQDGSLIISWADSECSEILVTKKLNDNNKYKTFGVDLDSLLMQQYEKDSGAWIDLVTRILIVALFKLEYNTEINYNISSLDLSLRDAVYKMSKSE